MSATGFTITRSMLTNAFEANIKPNLDISWGRYIYVGCAVNMGGICELCGASIKDDYIVFDNETNSYKSFGPVCSEKATNKTIAKLKQELSDNMLELRRKHQKDAYEEEVLLKRKIFRDLNPQIFEYLINNKDDNLFVSDMYNNLIKYGTISDKQVIAIELMMCTDAVLNSGERIELPVVFKKVKWYNGEFGDTGYAKFLNDNSEVITVKVSRSSNFGRVLDDMEYGWNGTIKGSVKNNKLTRVALVS
jgi:hypothetical protein